MNSTLHWQALDSVELPKLGRGVSQGQRTLTPHRQCAYGPVIREFRTSSRSRVAGEFLLYLTAVSMDAELHS
jgi:hypothetical protein